MKNILKRIFGGFVAIWAFLLISVSRKKHIRRFDDTMKNIAEFHQR